MKYILEQAEAQEKCRACGHWAFLNMETGELCRFLCGRPTCTRPECQRRFYRGRVALLDELIRLYGLSRFFTLTIDRSFSLQSSWDAIPYIWNKARTMLCREYPPFSYVAVLEEHMDGYPHIHGCTDTWIHWAEYKRIWKGCGGGHPNVKKGARSGTMADYMSKTSSIARYLSKDSLVKATYRRKGQRRLWRSKGLKTKAEMARGEGAWSLLKEKVFDNEGNLLYTTVSLGL